MRVSEDENENESGVSLRVGVGESGRVSERASE